MKIPEKAFYVKKLSDEGKTAVEIAEELGLTKKTVIYYLHLARSVDKDIKQVIRDMLSSFKSVDEFIQWVNSEDGGEKES